MNTEQSTLCYITDEHFVIIPTSIVDDIEILKPRLEIC